MSVSNGFFNALSMIYKMEMLDNDLSVPDYRFMVGTNNGIAILKIDKTTYAMSLAKEAYLQGHVINNFLVRGSRIIVFEHNA